MSNENQNEKVFYSKVNMLHRSKDAALETATYVVSGEISYADKKSGEYGDFVAITMTAVLGDKFVERNFGRELVTPDHKVQIRFNLSRHLAERFIQHTPRWGQDVIFMLYDMKVENFQRRSGETGYNVSAKCWDYAVLGSTKKADGSDRPVINIRGLDNASSANSKPASNAKDDVRTSVKEAMDSLGMGGDFEADDDLPF